MHRLNKNLDQNPPSFLARTQKSTMFCIQFAFGIHLAPRRSGQPSVHKERTNSAAIKYCPVWNRFPCFFAFRIGTDGQTRLVAVRKRVAVVHWKKGSPHLPKKSLRVLLSLSRIAVVVVVVDDDKILCNQNPKEKPTMENCEGFRFFLHRHTQ